MQTKLNNFDPKLMSRSKTRTNEEGMYGQCGGRPTSKVVPDIPLGVNYKNLGYLGSGFPLFYHLKLYTIIIYILMTLCVSIVCIIFNLREDKGDEWNDGEKPETSVKLSIGNFGRDKDNYDSMQFQRTEIRVNIIMGGIIIISSIIIRRLQRKLINKIDTTNVSPSDYALMIFGIPKSKTEEDVKEYFHSFNYDMEIVYVNFGYDVKDLMSQTKKLHCLGEERSQLLAFHRKSLQYARMTEDEAKMKNIFYQPPPTSKGGGISKKSREIEVVESEVKAAQLKLEEIKKEMNEKSMNNKLFGGICFVVNNKQITDKLIDRFQISIIRRIYNFIIYKICGCKRSKPDPRYWEGKRIKVEQAAEPSDVYWENLGYSTGDRVKKSMITYFVAFICLLIAFGINLGLSMAKDELDKNRKDERSAEGIMIRLISIFTALLVVMINQALGKVIRILSSYEKHETHTKYHISVGIKLVVATFINTGIVPMLVNFGKDNWFDRGGLMVDIFYNSLSVAFIGPLSYAFSPYYFMKRGKIGVEKCKGKNSKLTQRQANLLYEGPSLDMAQRYSNTMLLFALVLFFTFPLPIMPIIGIFGALFQYWVEKGVLLRRHKIPEQTGATLAEIFTKMIPFFLLLYSISIAVFSAEMMESRDFTAMVTVAGGVIYLFLPLNGFIYGGIKEGFKSQRVRYNEYYLNFINDYDRSNPITQKEASQRFLADIKTSHDKTKHDGQTQQEPEVDPILGAPRQTDSSPQNPIFYGNTANGEPQMYSTPAMYTQPRPNQIVPINTYTPQAHRPPAQDNFFQKTMNLFGA